MNLSRYYLLISSLLLMSLSGCNNQHNANQNSTIDVKSIEPTSDVINGLMSGKYESIKRDISITYPQIIVSPTNDFFTAINKNIEKTALGYVDEDIKLYSFSYQLGVHSQQLLSIKMNQYSYYDRAANGNASIFAINILVDENREATFNDIFSTGSLKGIKSMLTSKVSKHCKSFDESFNESDYSPRFFIDKTGIAFIFSEYEVTPGVCGGFAINLDYRELEPYLNQAFNTIKQ